MTRVPPISEHYLTVAARRCRWLECGDGPPILILSSMLVLARAYKPLLRALAARGRRAMALELPGSGRASRLPHPWTAHDYANWLADFLPAANLSRPSIIAHSNSGPPALILAADRTDLLSSLVLADTVGANPERPLWRILVGRAYDAILEWPLTVRGFWQLPYNLIHHGRNFLNQCVVPAHSDYLAHARRLSCPVLIAWGQYDHTLPITGALNLLESLPQANHYTSARGSHDWVITHAAEFAAAIAPMR